MEEGTSFVCRKAPHLYGGRHLISMEEGREGRGRQQQGLKTTCYTTTSALILYFSSTLVSTWNWFLSAFGNCFVNCSHAFFFAEASPAFVSGF